MDQSRNSKKGIQITEIEPIPCFPRSKSHPTARPTLNQNKILIHGLIDSFVSQPLTRLAAHTSVGLHSLPSAELFNAGGIAAITMAWLASYLQLFNGLPSLADDQAHFVGGNEDLVGGAVGHHVRVGAGPVATLLHDLVQQTLGLTGGAKVER